MLNAHLLSHCARRKSARVRPRHTNTERARTAIKTNFEKISCCSSAGRELASSGQIAPERVVVPLEARGMRSDGGVIVFYEGIIKITSRIPQHTHTRDPCEMRSITSLCLPIVCLRRNSCDRSTPAGWPAVLWLLTRLLYSPPLKWSPLKCRTIILRLSLCVHARQQQNRDADSFSPPSPPPTPLDASVARARVSQPERFVCTRKSSRIRNEMIKQATRAYAPG